MNFVEKSLPEKGGKGLQLLPLSLSRGQGAEGAISALHNSINSFRQMFLVWIVNERDEVFVDKLLQKFINFWLFDFVNSCCC